MNKEKRAFQFDDLIDDFFAALETDDESKVLEDYIKDFPEFEIDFLEAAAYKRTVSKMPDYEFTEEEEESLELRTQSIVQNLLYKYRQSEPATERETEKAGDSEPITSLIEEIEAKGFTVKEFAYETRLSTTIIEAFNTREVRFGSIVREAIQNVASKLGRPVQVISNYLQLFAIPEPTHMRASKAPEFNLQMEFLELVDTDPDMLDENKTYWLSQKPQESVYLTNQ